MYIKFDINLERMAMHRIALSFWDKDDVKTKTKTYFCKNKKVKSVKEWLDLTKYVVSLAQQYECNLPPIIYGKLIYIVRDVGLRLYGWFRYLQKSSMMNIRSQKDVYNNFFKDKIFWTHYGTIDEKKILKNWSTTPGTYLVPVYNMACLYCMQDEIVQTWGRLSKRIKKHAYQRRDLFKKTGVQLLGYWNTRLNYCRANVIMAIKIHSLDILDNEYNEDLSINENFFVVCSRKGFKFAVEYFWKLLNDKEKDSLLFRGLSVALHNLIRFRKEHEYYRKDLYIETGLFLINQCAEDVAESLFNTINVDGPAKKNMILKMCLYMWPWQELLIPQLEKFSKFLTRDNYLVLLYDLTDKLCSDYEFGMPIKNSLLQRLLRSVWCMMPAKFKEIVDEEIMRKLFDVWDLSNIKMILNDKMIAGKREELMKALQERTILIAEDDKRIKEWMYTIFVEEEPIKDENVMLAYEFLFKCDFDVLTNFYYEHWTSKEYITKRIDVHLICYRFIKRNELQSADEFLNWVFDSNVESIQNVKNSFKFDKFTYRHICSLWSICIDDIETAKSLSTNFLSWFLKTEDVLSFKEDHLKWGIEELKDFNKYDVRGFIDLFVEKENYQILEAFLDWCNFPQEKIRKIKTSIVKICIEDRCELYIKNNDATSAEKFLNWAYDTTEKKQNFLYKFMIKGTDRLDTPYGLICCQNLISESCMSEKESLEKFKAFIDFWVKPLEKIHEFKEALKKWAEDSSHRIPEDYETNDANKDTDVSSTSLQDSESEQDREPDYVKPVLCKQDNYRMFMSLLNAAVDSDEDD